jgi:hypothetical protein
MVIKVIDIDELIRILPKLIRENDTVKGAIISALSGVVATRDDIKELIHEMDKRFESMQKQIDKGFTETNKKFETVFRRLDEIAIGADVSFELFCIDMIKNIFKAEGCPVPYIEQRRHFVDPNHDVHPDTTDVEIDLFYPDPPLIGEVTYRASTMDKLDTFIKKIAFMERTTFKKTARRYFCALEIDPNLYSQYQIKAQKHQITVITKQIK